MKEKNNVNYLTEEELSKLDSQALSEYLLKLESIDSCLEKYIEENQNESK